MQHTIYKQKFAEFFSSDKISREIAESIELISQHRRIFFIGNGGSNAICSHMMEDFAKVLRYESFSFTDPALITCFANDYGYDHAMEEWLKVYFKPSDLLVAISSSGKSKNILGAVDFANSIQGNVITLSGFDAGNPLSKKGRINIHVDARSFGIVECFHQTIIHMILDEIYEKRK